jgi:ribonuclease HI
MRMLWTDGACLVNPGFGGWGVVVESAGQVERVLSGSVAHTTNNRMEMQAAIEGLRALPDGSCVTVHSDSQLLVKGMSDWMPGWRRSNFRAGRIKNIDLWLELLRECGRHSDVIWKWVRGHSGIKYNCLADKLANAAALAARSRGTGLEQPIRPPQPARTEQPLLFPSDSLI